MLNKVTKDSQSLGMQTYLNKFEKASKRTKNRGACRVKIEDPSICFFTVRGFPMT